MSETTDAISEACARRLRDIERAGRLRLRLVAAETDARELARFHRYRLQDRAAEARWLGAAAYYWTLYGKTCLLQARARGEAMDG